MRRAILGSLLALTAGLTLATSSPASSSTRATGPFFIVALNYPACVKASPNRPGTTVVQGDYHMRDCRKVFFDQRGTVGGKPYGRWETSTPVHVIAAPTCDLVSLQNQNATGDLWVENISGGHLQMVNKHCDEADGSNCLVVLAASGHIGVAWIVINENQHPGFFTGVRTVQQPQPQRVRSLHAGQPVSAGC